MFPTPLYDFQMNVTVTEANKGTPSFFTEIEKFAVLGGSKRTIKRYGLDGIGDADIMMEFHQAKQFRNLVFTKELNLQTLTFQRIYDHRLSFDFVLAVKSLEPQSRFRFIQLNAKKARIIKPPLTNDEGDTLSIKYSDPQVFYWYTNNTSVVFEEI